MRKEKKCGDIQRNQRIHPGTLTMKKPGERMKKMENAFPSSDALAKLLCKQTAKLEMTS